MDGEAPPFLLLLLAWNGLAACGMVELRSLMKSSGRSLTRESILEFIFFPGIEKAYPVKDDRHMTSGISVDGTNLILY